MNFWRKEVVDFALSQETQRHIAEQRSWIEREPANPLPYKNLAQLYRIEGRQDEALGLLLEAVRLDPAFADAHVELAQIYAIRADHRAAWNHAHAAERHGNPTAVDLLERYAVPNL
jgi:cytochrome c-type biogenesis protein CcmH/NrfG